MEEKIRISQCMIVKNEESNIRQALSWGKDIVQEQIVVDTGSTDNTVEIARNLGAKIFYFKWRDDFSAAKNFAIEKASGDWIVFLDADEYFSPEDTNKIPDIIKAAETQFSKDMTPDIIRATWAQLNDEGKVFAISEQDRIFRNRADIRYQNPIHEILVSNQGKPLRWLDVTELISIMHTGYLHSIVSEKGKRNVPILKKMTQDNPNDYNSWGYLAESLLAEGKDAEALHTAEKVMEEGLYKAQEPRINAALMAWYTAASSGNAGAPIQYKDKAYYFYNRYCETGYSFPDIEFGMGCYLMKIGETQAVIPFFETALSKLENYQGVNALKMAGCLNHIYSHLAMFYSEIPDAQKTVHYSTLSLRLDKYQDMPLAGLLRFLKMDKNTAANQAYTFLEKIYDMTSQKDRLFILKQAMKSDYKDLTVYIQNNMSKDELTALETNIEKPWYADTEMLKEQYPYISIKNRTDKNFLCLINELRQREKKELYKRALADKYIDSFKEHWKELADLYKTLTDYRSKCCLYGILEAWMHQENRIMLLSRENGLEFWDTDIIPTAEGMVYVDIGKHSCETLNGFLYTYDDTYKKIYCFPELKNSQEFDSLKESVSNCRDISVSYPGDSRLHLEQVITEPLDLIRIDTSSALIPLLDGNKEHICKEHPQLAICLDNDCNDLWRIPLLLKEWNNEYRFYLRYYGKNNVPDRIVLFSV